MVFPFGKPRRVYTRRRNYLSSFGTTRLPSLCRLIITSGGGGTTTTTTKQGVLARALLLAGASSAGVCLLCVFCVCVPSLRSSPFIGTREHHFCSLAPLLLLHSTAFLHYYWFLSPLAHHTPIL
jgi:hypothetical protein